MTLDLSKTLSVETQRQYAGKVLALSMDARCILADALSASELHKHMAESQPGVEYMQFQCPSEEHFQ